MFFLIPVLVIGFLLASVNTKPRLQSLNQGSVAPPPRDSIWRECQVIDKTLAHMDPDTDREGQEAMDLEDQFKSLGCSAGK